jgi:hypothetical protein
MLLQRQTDHHHHHHHQQQQQQQQMRALASPHITLGQSTDEGQKENGASMSDLAQCKCCCCCCCCWCCCCCLLCVAGIRRLSDRLEQLEENGGSIIGGVGNDGLPADVVQDIKTVAAAAAVAGAAFAACCTIHSLQRRIIVSAFFSPHPPTFTLNPSFPSFYLHTRQHQELSSRSNVAAVVHPVSPTITTLLPPSP